jgi:hypothetical protein
MDPDPGGPKTYGNDASGFGSATLLRTEENKMATNATTFFSALGVLGVLVVHGALSILKNFLT